VNPLIRLEVREVNSGNAPIGQAAADFTKN
jgi:hypothetical protein